MKKLLHKSLQLFLWFAILGFVAPISVVAADCYIAGSFNGWNATATQMTQNGSQYELFKTFDAGTQFKIVYNGGWYGYDAVKNGTDLVSSADGDNKNIQFKATGCYGLFFKNNGELYITKHNDCPQAYSLWGFDILYQEGDTQKWASTKGSAEAWDGNFISTSGDNEVYDMGVVKRGTRFIGFRFYTNENGSSVDGANVIWKNLTDEHDAIEGANYGIWSSNGSQSGTHGGTDEVWHVTDRKNKFLGYDNGTYSFYLVFELKADGKEKAMVRTITINYTINEFDLTTDLQGPAYVGDVVNLTVSGGTAPYTWQQSDDEVSWSTLSGASGTTYAHKVVDKTFIRVVDADGKITKVVEIAPSIKCDPANTIVVFKEDFGTLPSVDARTSYSKVNVPVEGTTITYSASVPYTAETESCAAMTDAGYYAVLANPRNAGCGTGVAQGVANCNCYNSSERWYRVTEDHTPDDVNGGMLIYNCDDGTSKTDVLYECTINGICANTYINFSAFVTCANTGRSGNIPIEAEFKLFNADTGAELSTSPVTNIGLNEEWKEISAMFNSADATRVKIQLINKADAGQGNDLLFDDMTLSVCTPDADLVCSDGKSVEKILTLGNSEELTAEILSGVMSNPFYLWQYQTNRANWMTLTGPTQGISTLTVTPEASPTYYRVILANTAQEALNIAAEGNPSACGMYAITNNVTLYSAYVTLTSSIDDGSICADATDANMLTLAVTNTCGTDLTNAEVMVGIPAAYINQITVASGTGFSNGKWTIGAIAHGETKTLKLTLKTNANLDELSKTVALESYVSKLASGTWNSYQEATMKASSTITIDKLPTVEIADQKGSQSLCATSDFTVAVDTDASSGIWSLVSGAAGIASPNTKETEITGVAAGATVKVKYTATNGVCASVSSNEISLTNLICNNFALTSQITPTAVCLNGQATLKLSITNNSEAPSSNIIAKVTLPSGLKYVSHTGDGVYDNDTGKWTISSLGIVDENTQGSGVATLSIVVEAIVVSTHTVNAAIVEALATPVTGVSATAMVTVNALPTAAFSAISSEVCADANELTNAQVTFTGASTFDLTYQVNSGANITKTGLTSPYIIEEQLSANGTLQLVSVKDANGCVGTITGQTHSVTADYYPTIQDITKPATICEGNALSLTVPTVEANGSTLGTANWVLNGATFNSSSTLSATQNNQELKYAVAYTCGRQTSKTVSSNVVNITVDAKPSAAVAGAAQTQCNNGTFTLAATTPEVGEGTWTLTSGSGSIADASSATSQVTNVPVSGSATLKWTVSNGVCEANNSTVVLTNNDCTNLNLTAGTAPVVCDGNEATFTFTLTNGSGVKTTDVTSTITLGSGLSNAVITYNGQPLAGNTWVVPSMEPGDVAELTIKANATTTGATATVKVDKASEVSVNNVQASVTATVNALPTAAFDITSSTICIDEQDNELTNIKVNFAGAAPFELTYQDAAGSTYVENNLPASAVLLNQALDGDESYTLKSVTDANGCTSAITGQTHQVTTQTHASLGVLTAPEGVCEGSVLALTAPTVTNNKGAVVTNPKWFLDGNEFDPATTVNNAQHNGKELYYQITSSCNGNVRDITTTPAVDVTVYATPQLSVKYTDPKGNEVTATQISCAIPYLTATLSGATSYTWKDGSTANPRVLGQKGQTTTYQVTGVTAQNCTSAALTFTITEDFVAPDVAITLPTLGDADEPFIDNKTLTCHIDSILLTASSSKNVTYTWNDAKETEGSTLKVGDKGEYQVTAVSADNGCSSTAVQSIGINKTKPTLSVATTDNSTIINCSRTSIEMTPSVSNEAAVGGDVSYTWYKEDVVFTETEATEAGLYKVVAVGKNGCSNEVSLNITADTDTLAMDLTATEATITCAHPVSVLETTLTDLKDVSLLWSTGEKTATIQVKEGGTYSVTATAPNGCESKAELELDQKTDLPKVEITPTDAVQLCRVNTLTASGATTYLWSTGATGASIEVSEAGTYSVTGTNEYGCKKDTTLVLTDGKVIPVVKVESNPSVITCTNENVTFTASVSNAINEHTYAYQWTINNETAVQSSKNTLSVADGKTYKVVVTDKDNFCQGEKTYSVSVKKETPLVVQDAAWAPVCLPATINLEDAIDATKTTADKVLFFEDEELTKPVTNTQIDMDTYKVYYAQGIEVNGNGCIGVATPIAVNLKPATPAPTVKDYDECVKAESGTFSPLVTSESYKLTFYDVAQGGTPIADAFDASKANTTATYYVTNTNQGACESERVAFEVAIAGLVDIELDASETSLMVGGDPVVITVTSVGVDPDTYRWMANGKELQVEGEEYEVNLYVDTKFEVAASGRCNSVSKEVDVEVLWPTAFTPYNNNGLNETFAKGLPVSIFNRFGIQVYEGADGWDGVMNKNMGANEMALPGVYYYAVPLPDGNVKKGTIEIVKF